MVEGVMDRQDDSLRDLYRDLLRLGRENPSLRTLDLEAVKPAADDVRKLLAIQRGDVMRMRILSCSPSIVCWR